MNSTNNATSKAAASAVILFAHGARDPEWAAPIRRVQDALRRLAPQLPVEAAFLEFMSPTLPECVATLAQGGSRQIVVVPMFIAQGGHLKRDIPELLASLRTRYPQLELRLAPAVGEDAGVVEAMALAALAASN